MTSLLATREAVKAALDIAETARANTAIDRALAAATETVERTHLHRTFRPIQATRSFPWPHPDRRGSRRYRLWLDNHDLISVDTLVSGGETIPATDYFLEPVNDGPPFTLIEIDLSSTSSFSSGDSHQRAIVATGLWGHSNTDRSAGALAEALDTTETGIDVTDGSVVGIGDVLRVDSERLEITDRTWLDSGQNLGAALTADMSDRTVDVTDGTAYAAGELLLIGAETMLITSIAGNSLIVRRAWDGSVLEVHALNDDIFASRRLTATRGALGTTAAGHTSSTALTAHVVPTLVEQLTIAEALVTLGLQRAAYALTSGAGEAKGDNAGDGLPSIVKRAQAAHGRQARFRSV